MTIKVIYLDSDTIEQKFARILSSDKDNENAYS